MRIVLNNSKSRIITSTPNLIKLRESKAFAVRVKGAFFSPAYTKGIWDGKKRFITETGQFDTGLLPMILRHIYDEYGEVDIEVVDERGDVTKPKLSRKVGPDTLRDDQYEVMESIVNHSVAGIPFPRGVVDVATNFGKTYIAASTFLTYDQPGILLLGDADLYEQLKVDLTRLLGEELGHMDSKSTKWAKYMIVMVKTCYNRMKKDPSIKQRLQSKRVCLVDEADLAVSKTYTTVLSNLHNAVVKIGLTGTAFRGRDKIKHMTFRGTFGDRIVKVTNAELIKKGTSAPVKVFIYQPCKHLEAVGASYPDVYDRFITKNKERNKFIMKQVKYLLSKGHKPIMVFCRYHDHIQELLKLTKHLPEDTVIDWAHGERDKKERSRVRKQFRDGEIDLLITSNIFNRGKNLPRTKVIINAAAGTSETVLLQGPIGRATRKHESKQKTMIIDYYDKGRYIELHSKRRIIFYKNEKLPVKEMHKLKK